MLKNIYVEAHQNGRGASGRVGWRGAKCGDAAIGVLAVNESVVEVVRLIKSVKIVKVVMYCPYKE